jgi:glyoxylase-like metal-dependent hydrolase (beta-lactamase superfamily II)
MPKYDDLLLQKVRAAGAAIPGQLPVSINYIKFAASIRQWKDIVEGGSEDPCTMARTAFQINYDKDYIMVDAGMDKAVHHFFEKQAPQPFDDTLANQVATALQSAKLILITHEHGDHVAGAIRNANNTVPSKTILTTDQANTLVNNPQMPEIKLDETKRDQYIIVDFASVLPVAPGVVLIKAPGHTPGEIMVYTKLANGREYIFTGDVSWSFKGIQEKKLKPKSERERLSEGTDNIRQEIDWLSDRLTKDNMIMLVSHDDIMLPQYEAQGLIGKGFKTLP